LNIISDISPLLQGSSYDKLIEIRIDAFDFVAFLMGLGLIMGIGIGGTHGLA
jgi:hypothetical protein